MTRIYQIYFNPVQLPHLDEAFTPYFNTSKLTKLREWTVIEQGPALAAKDGVDVWGFVSWKYRIKTNQVGKTFVDHIAANADCDMWYLEPSYMPDKVFHNPWTQGDHCHPGLSDIGKRVLDAMGMPMPDLLTADIPFCWYNFFAGNEKFWTPFLAFIHKFIAVCESDAKLRSQVFEESAGYEADATVPRFIFLLERFVPTFLYMHGTRAAGLKYHHHAYIYKR